MDIDSRLQAALDLHQRGNIAEAAAAYQEILRENPDHPGALHLLGVILKDTGEPAGAVRLIQRAVDLGRRDFATLNNLALAHLGAGDAKSAVTLLAELVAAPGLQRQERLEAILNLALAQLRDGPVERAMLELSHHILQPAVPADILLATASLCRQADLDGARPALRPSQPPCSQRVERHCWYAGAMLVLVIWP